MNSREVSSAAFWAAIGPRDSVGTVVGRWPYTTVYRERHSESELGRVVSVLQDGSAIPENKYYLRESGR